MYLDRTLNKDERLEASLGLYAVLALAVRIKVGNGEKLTSVLQNIPLRAVCVCRHCVCVCVDIECVQTLSVCADIVCSSAAEPT